MLDNLGGQSKDLLVRACAQFEKKQARVLECCLCGDPGEQRKGPGRGATRQAFHQGLHNAITSATAGSIVLAARDPMYRQFVLSDDFARLKPYRADTYAKFEQLVAKGQEGHRDQWHRLFEESSKVFVHIGAAGPAAAREERLCAAGYVALMGTSLVVCGEDLLPAWSSTWNDAKKRGVLNRPFFRLSLSLLGSFAGEWKPYVEWLIDSNNWKMEVADSVIFVREDLGQHVEDCICKFVVGDVDDLLNFLQPNNRVGTLLKLVKFARTAMRRNPHFHTPGLVLAILYMAKAGAELFELLKEQYPVHGRDLQRPEVQPQDVERMNRAFRSLRATQRMEQKKFKKTLSLITDDYVRNHIETLWNQLLDPNSSAAAGFHVQKRD